MTVLGMAPDVIFDAPSTPSIAFAVPTAQPDLLLLPVSGSVGPTGPSTGTVTATAGATLSGHRIVRAQIDGTLVYASSATVGDITRDLFLTLGSANMGDTVMVQAFGEVTEPSWSWTDAPVFLGQNGILTQTPPSKTDGSTFIRQVGYPVGPTVLFFNPRNPIAL